MTIKERIAYLEAIEETMAQVEGRMRGYMTAKVDPNTGEYVMDENGEFVMVAPEKGNQYDEYDYRRYSGFRLLLTNLEKLAEKC
jgi:hypothetical protein